MPTLLGASVLGTAEVRGEDSGCTLPAVRLCTRHILLAPNRAVVRTAGEPFHLPHPPSHFSLPWLSCAVRTY